MITSTEVVAAIGGALRLARRDAAGLAAFDASIGGFWRSFFAAVLLVPLYLALILVEVPPRSGETGGGVRLLVEAIAYVMAWFAFPLAMLPVTRLLDRERHYLLFIVASNWTTVVQSVAVALGPLLIGLGVAPPFVGQLLAWIATLWALTYKWYVVRESLEVGGGAAAGVVALEIVIGLAITAWANALEG